MAVKDNVYTFSVSFQHEESEKEKSQTKRNAVLPTLKQVLDIVIDNDCFIGSEHSKRGKHPKESIIVKKSVVDDLCEIDKDFRFLPKCKIPQSFYEKRFPKKQFDYDFLSFEWDGEVEEVFALSFSDETICNYKEIFELHSIDFENYIHNHPLLEKFNVSQKIDEFSDEMKNLYCWREDLSKISDGYTKQISYDLGEKMMEFSIFRGSLMNSTGSLTSELYSYAVKDFFNYSESRVIDLSVYRNVFFTHWGGMVSLYNFLMGEIRKSLYKFCNNELYNGKNHDEIREIYRGAESSLGNVAKIG